MSSTTWFYRGEDSNIYGPSTSDEMMSWYRAGYFDGNLLVKTAKEDSYHSLNDWIRVCGQAPFFLPVDSMDSALVYRMNTINMLSRQHITPCISPVMLVPVSATTILPSGMVQTSNCYSTVPPGIAPSCNGGYQPTMSHIAVSELADNDGASTASHTPDSDRYLVNDTKRLAMIDASADTCDAPWLINSDVSVQTLRNDANNATTVGVQTDTITVSPTDAQDFIFALLGFHVNIGSG